MPKSISIVIPARNEEDTVAAVVSRVRDFAEVAEIVVVNNASDDRTAERAEAAGARVVDCRRPGLGEALKTGFAAAKRDLVLKLDADLGQFDPGLVPKLVAAFTEGTGMVKGSWFDPTDDLPMTRLLIRPLIRQIFPEIDHIQSPNSGIYLIDRRLVELSYMPSNNSADLDVMLQVSLRNRAIREVEIGKISHDPRDRDHYNAMAENILELFLRYHSATVTRREVGVSCP